MKQKVIYMEKMSNTRTRRRLLALVVDMVADGQKQHDLMRHLWLLDNRWALLVAMQLNNHLRRGKPPDNKGSLVLKRMFERAIAIVRS